MEKGRFAKNMTLPPVECRVNTPPHLAKAMIQAIGPGSRKSWLDPCMGPGVFIACLREKGIQKQRIVGIDIDPDSGAEDKSARTVRGVDFFHWCISTAQKFDRIVANPPYVAIRKLHPQLQDSLAALRCERDGSFALRSNYWCAFLSACLRVLANDGNLAFVLPAAWDYALYASDVRHTVHKQFESVAVHRSLEPLFPHVQEGCVVLVAKGYRKTPRKAVRIAHESAEALISALTQDGPKLTKRHGVAQFADRSLTAFSDLYDVRIGCVTGDASYFLLRESDRVRLDLPRESVRPVVSKARHLTTGYLTSSEWDRLRRADERVWMFYPESKVLRHRAVQAYLEHGRKRCNLAGYKLSHRDPWYRVHDIRRGVSGFLSGMTKLGPWICFRAKRELVATNTLYALHAKTDMKSEERAAWALSLLCTSSRKQFHKIARRYPDGLPKLEPHDVNSIRLPSPQRTRGAVEEYSRAVDYLLNGKIKEAVAIADTFTQLR